MNKKLLVATLLFGTLTPSFGEAADKSAKDKSISRRFKVITSALEKEGMIKDLKVQVNDSQLWIKGQVGSRQIHDAILQIARRIKGVKRVINGLAIRERFVPIRKTATTISRKIPATQTVLPDINKTLRSLRVFADNEFLYDDKLKEVIAQIQKQKGKAFDLELEVHHVSRKFVEATFERYPICLVWLADKKKLPSIKRTPDTMSHELVRQYKKSAVAIVNLYRTNHHYFPVNNGVGEKLARQLRANNQLIISGKIKEIHICPTPISDTNVAVIVIQGLGFKRGTKWQRQGRRTLFSSFPPELLDD